MVALLPAQSPAVPRPVGTLASGVGQVHSKRSRCITAPNRSADHPVVGRITGHPECGADGPIIHTSVHEQRARQLRDRVPAGFELVLDRTRQTLIASDHVIAVRWVVPQACEDARERGVSAPSQRQTPCSPPDSAALPSTSA